MGPGCGAGGRRATQGLSARAEPRSRASDAGRAAQVSAPNWRQCGWSARAPRQLPAAAAAAQTAHRDSETVNTGSAACVNAAPRATGSAAAAVTVTVVERPQAAGPGRNQSRAPPLRLGAPGPALSHAGLPALTLWHCQCASRPALPATHAGNPARTGTPWKALCRELERCRAPAPGPGPHRKGCPSAAPDSEIMQYSDLCLTFSF